MSRYIQLSVYCILAGILAIDGIRTLFHHENVFYKKGIMSAVPSGLLLISAAGVAASFGIRLIFQYSWTQPLLWFFIAASGIMMVWMIIGQEQKK